MLFGLSLIGSGLHAQQKKKGGDPQKALKKEWKKKVKQYVEILLKPVGAFVQSGVVSGLGANSRVAKESFQSFQDVRALLRYPSLDVHGINVRKVLRARGVGG